MRGADFFGKAGKDGEGRQGFSRCVFSSPSFLAFPAFL